MPSNSALAVPQQIFVWIWLPGEVDPVVCGRMITAADGRVIFNYGQSYLARQDAIPRRKDAIETVAGMIEAIRGNWEELCDQAAVSSVERRLFADQMFLTAYAFDELEDDATFLAAMASDTRDFLRG